MSNIAAYDEFVNVIPVTYVVNALCLLSYMAYLPAGVAGFFCVVGFSFL